MGYQLYFQMSTYCTTNLDAYGETFALPECLLPVIIPVVVNNYSPAQNCGGGGIDCHSAVTDMLTGWSMYLQKIEQVQRKQI